MIDASLTFELSRPQVAHERTSAELAGRPDAMALGATHRRAERARRDTIPACPVALARGAR